MWGQIGLFWGEIRRKGTGMFKNLVVFMMLLLPVMDCVAAPKKEKEEPVVHLTDEQIYEELKKLALLQ